MNEIVEVAHPLIKHHLARLRSTSTAPDEFRALIGRLAGMLAYEATRDLTLRPVEVQTPITTTTGQTLAQRIGLVPILRAGL
jgi:uracil phosphoribosyltransferase